MDPTTDGEFFFDVRVVQNKDRVNMELIKPAVNWRTIGAADASASAAVARH